MKKHIWLVPVLVGIGVGLTLLLAPSKTAQREHLATPQNVPAVIRAALSKRMERHGNDMVDLSWSVILLRYDTAAALARRIADEPPVARSLGDVETPANAALPERFFELQDSLRANTRELAEAATAQDPTRVGATYAKVAQTCVACHALYLGTPSPAAPPAAVPPPPSP